jgi:L-alanine-DL-glutamate epimerase-like enolase superfamily enzyme
LKIRIDRVEIFVLSGANQSPGFASDMPSPLVTHTVLRLTTADGLVGIAGADSFTDHAFDITIAETLRTMAPIVVGRSILERERIWNDIKPKVYPRAPQAQSLLDVAIWDALAKSAGLPLYQLLGGALSKIRSYASTPMLESTEAYVDLVAQLKEEGYSAIKFHCWCEEYPDLKLVAAIHKAYGDRDTRFMLDVEQRYTFESALRVGRTLDEYGYEWFEAPISDSNLAGYKKLASELRVPIVCAGNTLTDPSLIAFALSHDCWDRVRVDALTCGGITPALKVMHLAAAHGVKTELQCWGHALVQAANLHLMLGSGNCSYFEQPLDTVSLELGIIEGIRTDAAGFVTAPDLPGLGIELDDVAIAKHSLAKVEIR